MSAKKYRRKPFIIEAWQLTEDDLPNIALWCKGKVKGISITFPKIRDKSKTLETQDKSSYALLGQYIIRTNKGFIVMTQQEFEAKYDAVGLN